MIEFLTKTNQTLLDQVRAKDLATLAGLEQIHNNVEDTEQYITTDMREMQAYYASMMMASGDDDMIDPEDVAALRSGL